SATRCARFKEYFERACLSKETVTLFCPLAGRTHTWPQLADFFERQTWPHDQVRLFLFDTSQNDSFSQQVRNWISTCDYSDVRHVRHAVGRPGLADLPRAAHKREVSQSMARIYNRLAR